MELLSRHPVLGYAVTWISSGHERLLDTRILALGKLNAESTIVHLILSIRDRLVLLGAAREQVLPWPLTQEQIADCLGMTSVHVSRTFKRLAARGLIGVASYGSSRLRSWRSRPAVNHRTASCGPTSETAGSLRRPSRARDPF